MSYDYDYPRRLWSTLTVGKGFAKILFTHQYKLPTRHVRKLRVMWEQIGVYLDWLEEHAEDPPKTCLEADPDYKECGLPPVLLKGANK